MILYLLKGNNFAIKHLLVFFLLSFLFTSCKEDRKLTSNFVESSLPIINHQVKKEIHLPLDSLSSPLISYFQVIEGDTTLLLFYNQYNKSLYFYDFYDESLLKISELTHPVKTVPSIESFYYINKDSILFFPEYGQYFLIGDEEGNLQTKAKRFVDKDDENKIESHWISNSAPLTKLGTKLYINNVFGGIARDEDDESFLVIEYDFHSDSSNFLIKHPPSIYDRNIENSPIRHLSFTHKENSLVYSFGFDPFVYVKSGAETKSFYCADASFKIPPVLPKNISSEKSWNIFQTSPSYSKLTYDSHQKLLFRVYLKPYRLDDINSGFINPESPKKPELHVFNNSFKPLGRIQLSEENEYYFPNSFATKKGFWIQRIEKENEDIICFERIDYEL